MQRHPDRPNLQVIRTDPGDTTFLTPEGRRLALAIGSVAALGLVGSIVGAAELAGGSQPTRPIHRTVEPGQTLGGIAERFTEQLHRQGIHATFQQVEGGLKVITPAGQPEDPNQIAPGDQVVGDIPAK